MATPTKIVWELEPHTAAKHTILKRYLSAWIPILCQSNFSKVIYIDGFAGPGKYAHGEDGSPIIAIKAALANAEEIRSKLHFYFVELDIERANFLSEQIKKLNLPSHFTVTLHAKQPFEDAFEKIKLENTRDGNGMPPTFAFIDPFGWTGAPFSIVKYLLSQRSCEIFLNFMYEEINRFIGHDGQPQNFDSLFGSRAWEKAKKTYGKIERKETLQLLYQTQLMEDAKAKYVRTFEMVNRSGVTDYFLFYATNNRTGLSKMKEAMWKVDAGGSYSFSDATDESQMVMFLDKPNLDALKKTILENFHGKEPAFSEVEDFVLAQTAFRETHCKMVLKELESTHQLEVLSPHEGFSRRRGTFGSPNLKLKFLAEPKKPAQGSLL